MFFFCGSCLAQTDTAFWFAPPDLSVYHQQTPIRFCFTSYQNAATITVSQPTNSTFTPYTVTIPANGFATYDLSAYVDDIETKPVNTVLNRGFHITSTAPISCYYESVGNNSEIYTLKGSNSLGTDFLVPMQASYPSNTGHASPSSIEFIATEDSTTVDVYPTALIQNSTDPPRTPFTVTLNRGQSFAFRSDGYGVADHLGGTIIRSSKPIAVNSTDDCVDSQQGCVDLVGDQIVPTRLLGTRYVAIKNDSQFENIYLYSTQDSTNVTISGSTTTTVTLTDSAPYVHPLTDPATLITSDHPIAVFQLTGMSCELGGTMLPHCDCTGSFEVAHLRPSTNSMLLTIVTASDATGGFRLNGDSTLITAADFTPLAADTTLSWCVKDVSLQVNSNSVMRLVNVMGRFQLGIIDGSWNSDCSYGYFSDYGTSGSLRFNMETRYCPGSDIYFTYDAPNVTNITLSGPNELFFDTEPFILHGADTVFSGRYYVQGTDSSGCQGTLIDSIDIEIVSGSLRFDMHDTYCTDDDITFLYRSRDIDSVTFHGPNHILWNRPPYVINDADTSVSGTYWIEGDDTTMCHLHHSDTIHITVLNSYYGQESDTIAETQLPWTHRNVTFNYEVDTLFRCPIRGLQCDSLITYHLRVWYNIHDTILYYICNDQLPFVADSNTFYGEGSITRLLHGIHGEDSLVTTILNIIPVTDTTIFDTIVDSQLPWFVADTVFTDSASDVTLVTTNEAGCDSIIHYNLYIFWNGDHCDTTLEYPTFVTPNGDGINDRFIINGLLENHCFKYNELSIYDRNGHRVHHVANIQDESQWWDPNQKHCPDGTYFYYFKAHGVNIWTSHTGVIEVFRDK